MPSIFFPCMAWSVSARGNAGGAPCLIVLVACPDGDLPQLPATLEGYPVCIEMTRRLQAKDPD